MTNDRVWIEFSGDVILARVRGEPTEDLVQTVHDQILLLARDTGKFRILYDCLEMLAPPVQVPISQQKLDANDPRVPTLRRAIVVPDAKLAFLARLAFGDGDYRVFYHDLSAALTWLQHDG